MKNDKERDEYLSDLVDRVLSTSPEGVFSLDYSNIDMEQVAQDISEMNFSEQESTEHYIYLCPTSLDPLEYNVNQSPHVSCFPRESSLHQSIWDPAVAFCCPNPSAEEGDRGKLFCIQADHDYPVNDYEHYQLKWLTRNCPLWDVVAKLSASINPRDRLQFICDWLKSTEGVLANANVEAAVQIQSMESRFSLKKIIDEFADLIDTYNSYPVIEDSWSPEIIAYEERSLSDMERLFSENLEPRLMIGYYEEIVRCYYYKFLTDKSFIKQLYKWANEFQKRANTLVNHIEAVGGKRTCVVYQYLAMALERIGKLQDAIRVCKRAIELDLHDSTKGGYVKRLDKLEKKFNNGQ